jgi:hypothetical protein
LFGEGFLIKLRDRVIIKTLPPEEYRGKLGERMRRKRSISVYNKRDFIHIT